MSPLVRSDGVFKASGPGGAASSAGGSTVV